MNDRLKSLRKSRRLTQYAVRQRIGISQQEISRFERNIDTVTAAQLVLLSDFFKVSIDYILGRTEIAQTPERQHMITPALVKYYEVFQVYELLNENNQELVRTLMDKMLQQEAVAKV